MTDTANVMVIKVAKEHMEDELQPLKMMKLGGTMLVAIGPAGMPVRLNLEAASVDSYGWPQL